ncbi:hypothetical protein NBO_366gi001 [Nosema bombycis CQ1]|uniref:Uncharacterized protein n=1 Tax=Nosema bombycis (strain CQ1 / CVCC 102059) TaxID=578461 RepID=R0KRF1_NOSB1|nr:hypothetical protein NBO_366gi001 [Nosema bombycis CQ1]|eukprot:EOB12787.1 hypothetical protein NBO_366gi001 [Nosema bombycis CQ1]
MDLLRKNKLQELRDAILNLDKHFLVLYGPSGSLKSTVLKELCTSLGLNLEYVNDISKYKNKLLRGDICYTDIDNQDYILKNKHIIEKMRNLIIETRSYQSIWKCLKNCKMVEFRKISNNVIKKMVIEGCGGVRKVVGSKVVGGKVGGGSKGEGYNKAEEESPESLTPPTSPTPSPLHLQDIYEIIDGNLHKLPFYKFSSKITTIDIYRYIGRLFYSKNISTKTFPQFKITNYLFSNSISFFTGLDLWEVYEGFSLTDFKLEEFYENSEYLVFSKKKRNLGKSKFKSMSMEEGHICEKRCEEYRNTK